MAGQLGYLLEAIALPTVSLGMIPFTACRTAGVAAGGVHGLR